jgi:hypothetical protein
VRRLRIAAVVVMILGFMGVGLVYWIASRSDNGPSNGLAIDYYKKDQLQLERMYGAQGTLAADIYTALQQPGTQAVIILVAAALISVGCLFFSKLPEHKPMSRSTDNPPES